MPILILTTFGAMLAVIVAQASTIRRLRQDCKELAEYAARQRRQINSMPRFDWWSWIGMN